MISLFRHIVNSIFKRVIPNRILCVYGLVVVDICFQEHLHVKFFRICASQHPGRLPQSRHWECAALLCLWTRMYQPFTDFLCDRSPIQQNFKHGTSFPSCENPFSSSVQDSPKQVIGIFGRMPETSSVWKSFFRGTAYTIHMYLQNYDTNRRNTYDTGHYQTG